LRVFGGEAGVVLEIRETGAATKEGLGGII
jgi:hypothetical protein